MQEKQKAELIALVNKRILLPNNYISLDYRKKNKLLLIRFSDKKVIYSKADMNVGVIYDFDSNDSLINIEILDFVYEECSETVEPKTKRDVRRKNRKNKITRHCCKHCGRPKHYVCLNHHQMPTPKISFLIRKRIRYFSRKICFNLARCLRFEV